MHQLSQTVVSIHNTPDILIATKHSFIGTPVSRELCWKFTDYSPIYLFIGENSAENKINHYLKIQNQSVEALLVI